MSNAKLFIPLLCYNHTCNTEYMMSILKTLNTFKDKNQPCTFYPIFFESLVSRARNAAVAHFLDSDCTHLMFIDSDIIFEPKDILKLVNAKQEVIAGMYPKKYIAWDRLKKNPEASRVDFPMGGKVTLTEEGLYEVGYLPTGFLLITRSAIKKLIRKHPELEYRNDIDGYGTGGNFYNLFNVGIRNGIYESEDWGFCSLWKEAGGKVLIHPKVNVKHVGWHEYEGDIEKYLIENTKNE